MEFVKIRPHRTPEAGPKRQLHIYKTLQGIYVSLTMLRDLQWPLPCRVDIWWDGKVGKLQIAREEKYGLFSITKNGVISCRTFLEDHPLKAGRYAVEVSGDKSWIEACIDERK